MNRSRKGSKISSPKKLKLTKSSHLVEDHEGVLHLAVQVATNCDGFGDGRTGVVDVALQFQHLPRLVEDFDHVLGVKFLSMETWKAIFERDVLPSSILCSFVCDEDNNGVGSQPTLKLATTLGKYNLSAFPY